MCRNRRARRNVAQDVAREAAQRPRHRHGQQGPRQDAALTLGAAALRES